MIEFLKRLFFYGLMFSENYTGIFFSAKTYADIYPSIKREVEKTSIFITFIFILVGLILLAIMLLLYTLFFFVKSPEEISEFWNNLGNDIKFILTGKES